MRIAIKGTCDEESVLRVRDFSEANVPKVLSMEGSSHAGRFFVCRLSSYGHYHPRSQHEGFESTHAACVRFTNSSNSVPSMPAPAELR
jgi:hypothetical protein